MAKVVDLTPDEILSTIAHSAFPSIVTEGRDDVIVYRRFEDEFYEKGLTLIAAGGRSTVLKAFEQRHTLPANARAVFVVDRDLWVLNNIPINYVAEQLVFTDGYSIENDMFRDGDLETLLTGEGKNRFAAEMQMLCRWFALMVTRCAIGGSERLNVHPASLLESALRYRELMELAPGEVYPELLKNDVCANYSKLLRA